MWCCFANSLAPASRTSLKKEIERGSGEDGGASVCLEGINKIGEEMRHEET